MTQPIDEDLTINGRRVSVPGVRRQFHRGWMLAVLLIPFAMSQMSMSSINVAVPAITQGLGASAQAVQLLISGYVLMFGVVLVAAGRIGDVLGRCATFIAGVTIFASASLVSALAPDATTLTVARFIQGLGSGLAAPQTNGMIVQYFSGQARARAFAWWGPTVSLSISLGPVITGAFINALGPERGWRASFFWNVPLGLLAIVLACFLLPFEQERAQHSAHRKERSYRLMLTKRRLDLDPVGMILLTTTVLAIMLPFIIRRADAWWLLALGGLGLLGWIAWERRYRARGGAPMVDLSLFKRRSFSHAIAVSAVSFMAAPALLLIIPLFVQQAAGVKAFQAGLIGVPNALAVAVASFLAGRQVLRRGRTNSVLAQVINICGVLLIMALVAPIAAGRLSFWWLALAAIIPGFGVGLLNASNLTLAQLEVPREIGATAGGVKQTTERIGTAIGQAILTGLLFSTVPGGWVPAMTMTLGAIVAIFAISLALASYDLRCLGNPSSRAA